MDKMRGDHKPDAKKAGASAGFSWPAGNGQSTLAPVSLITFAYLS